MKIQNIIITSCVSLMLFSCAEDFNKDYAVDKTESVAIKEYLSKYHVLKSYVDSLGSPSFRLGATINKSDFLQKGILYSQLRSNFSEVSFADAFMHNQLVDASGIVDSTSLTDAVTAANDCEMPIFGSSLCCPENQQASYLNNLIADVYIPGSYSSGTFVVADFEKDELGNSYPMSGVSTAIVEKDPAGESGKALHVGNNDVKAAYSFPHFHVKLPAGKTLGDFSKVLLDMKAPGSNGLYGSGMKMRINSGTQVSFGSPASFGCGSDQWGRGLIQLALSNMNFTEAEKALTEFDLEIGSGTGSGNYYIDNINMFWEKNQSGQTIVKTAEEKKTIISGELQKYITTLIKAYGNDIKSWTIASNFISGDNVSELLRNSTNEPNANNFYWQDYMGGNFVPMAIAYAKSSKSDLKLFVSENGLEKTGSSKLQKLITQISQWESNGITIDGINAQIHLVYSMNASTQSANENAIVNMLKELSSTKKLVRLENLDMQMTDENGVEVNLANLSNTEMLVLAKYYNFVVQKYIELIPASQRVGISQTSINGGSKVGLWDSNYNRKSTYIGVADGLSGSETITVFPE